LCTTPWLTPHPAPPHPTPPHPESLIPHTFHLQAQRHTPHSASWKKGDVSGARRKLSLQRQQHSEDGEVPLRLAGNAVGMDTKEDEISATAALLSLAGMQ